MKNIIIASVVGLLVGVAASLAYAQILKREVTTETIITQIVQAFGKEVANTGQLMAEDGKLMQTKGNQYKDNDLVNNGSELEKKGTNLSDLGVKIYDGINNIMEQKNPSQNESQQQPTQ